MLVTPNLSLFEKTPERNAAVSRTPTTDHARGEALPQPPEDDSGGTPVVSPRHPDGNPSMAFATHTTTDPLSSLNGPRSLNDEIIASSSSKSETPKLTINTNRARANPVRHPRYRSQRDTIIAHLRGSVTTPGRSTQSLLARMTDQTVAELNNVSGDDHDDHDADVAKRTARTLCGEGHVYFTSSTAERSSGLSDSDDPPGGPKREEPEERTVTHLIQGMIGVICLATRAPIMSIFVDVFFYFFYFLQKKGRSCSLDHPACRVVVLHLLTRIYLTGYMMTMTRRRLPLRRRAYAHRYGSVRALLPNAGLHTTTFNDDDDECWAANTSSAVL